MLNISSNYLPINDKFKGWKARNILIKYLDTVSEGTKHVKSVISSVNLLYCIMINVKSLRGKLL